MSFNFPDNPVENDEFVPLVGGQTYIYKHPRWLVKGIPPIAGEGSGGIDEAPIDGNQYAREDATWTEIYIPPSDWASIPDKPDTFPPTVPIAQSDVTNLVTDLASKAPEAPSDGNYYGRSGLEARWEVVDQLVTWTNLRNKPSTFPPTLPIPWTDVSGKPSTFPPTLPIAQADVTNLSSDLALKAPLAAPVFTGDARAVTPATGDNDTSIATTAFVKAQSYLTTTTAASTYLTSATAATTYAPLASPVFTGDARAVTPATSDNDTSVATTAYVKANLAALPPAGATVSDAAPSSPTSGQLWFESDTGLLFIYYNDGTSSQWVPATVNAPGLAGGGSGSTAWADITGKPATFPPTVPIASTNISGLGTAAVRNVHVGTSAPGSPATNDVWIDTT